MFKKYLFFCVLSWIACLQSIVLGAGNSRRPAVGSGAQPSAQGTSAQAAGQEGLDCDAEELTQGGPIRHERRAVDWVWVNRPAMHRDFRGNRFMLHHLLRNPSSATMKRFETYLSQVDFINRCDEQGMTPLHLAADFEGVDAAGRPLAVDFVERLIDFQRQFQSTFSLFINARDRLNRTALHLAAARGDAAVVELLLAADAWLLTQDMQDRTPVWIAAQAGHVGPLELMIRSVERPHLLFRVVPQGASFWDFQHNPAVWGIIGRYVMMAEGQPSVTMTTTTDLNRVADTVALPCAVDPGLVQFYFYQAIGSEDLRALIEAIDIYGADVNARDQGGWTALWIAAARANLPMVQALLDRGAALNEIPPSYPRGATLLHLAAAHTNYDLAACLIARGFNMYAVDGFGQTPLSIAANQAQGNVLALFEAEAQRAHQQMLADAPVMPVARALPDGMPSVLLDAVSRGDIDYVDLLLGGYRYERGDLEAALSVARGLGYDTIQARIEQQLVPLRVAGVALHRSI